MLRAFIARQNTILKLPPPRHYGISLILSGSGSSYFEVASTEALWYKYRRVRLGGIKILKLPPPRHYGIDAVAGINVP